MGEDFSVSTDDQAAYYDPAKEPCAPEYHVLPQERTWPLAGPGGKTNIRENNEKGILEENVQDVVDMHQYAPLGSNHDSYRMGIYATNSVGDRD